MIRFMCLAFIIALSVQPLSAGAAAPLPILQMDYPVLEVGETGFIKVQVPPHNGAGGGQSYIFYMKRQHDEYDPGYRLLYAHCPWGFRGRHFNNTESECYRIESGPHPAFEVTLEIKNVFGVDGLTMLPDALVSIIGGVGRVDAPLRLYGID